MSLKELWAKVDTWWTSRDNRRVDSYVAVDKDGLIRDDAAVVTVQADGKRPKPGGLEIVKRSGAVEKKENIEKLGKAFDRLIDRPSQVVMPSMRSTQPHNGAFKYK